ncbi:MAG: ArnT family glycosyltransferase [Phycisphaerae bacterium]
MRSLHVPRRLVILVALAAIFRLPGLDRVPPPLNQDEASRGYDAWCLLETGADRHGERLPFFLESFGPGDNTAALTTWLTVPFVAWLGPTPTAMRLPDALLAVATVALLYIWLRRWIGETVALIAAAVLALDPWHIALTRTAHESGFTPFFLVFALLAMDRAGLLPGGWGHGQNAGGDRAAASLPPATRADGGSRIAWGFAAGVLLSLYAWAYPATRFFTPLFGLAIGIIYLRIYINGFRSGRARRVILSAATGLILGTIPLWHTARSQPERLVSRARATLLIHQERPIPDILRAFTAHYIAHLDPRYAFLQADEMSGASIPRIGLHLIGLAPIWLIGLIRILAGLRRDSGSRLLFAWLLLYPIPAAICSDWNPHPMRSVAGIPLFPIITALGGRWLIDRLALRTPKTRRRLAVSAGILLLLNLAHFTQAYYRRFPSVAADAYQTNLLRAIEFAADRDVGADFILVTNEANQPYIYALLSEPIRPADLAGHPLAVTPGPKGFHQVLRAGRFLFVPIDPVRYPEAKLRFQAILDNLPNSVTGLVIERDGPDGIAFDESDVIYRTSSDPGADAVKQRHYRVRRWHRLRVGPIGAHPAGGG